MINPLVAFRIPDRWLTAMKQHGSNLPPLVYRGSRSTAKSPANDLMRRYIAKGLVEDGILRPEEIELKEL